MSTLKELMVQKQALDAQIAEVTKAERKDALVQIRELMTLHGIPEVKLEKTVNKVAPKWKDPVTGTEWSGRGRTPAVFAAAKANGTLESMAL